MTPNRSSRGNEVRTNFRFVLSTFCFSVFQLFSISAFKMNVITVENLGKKYRIKHQAERQRHPLDP